MKAILVVSHGSRSPETKKEVGALTQALRQLLPGTLVEFAFLEIASPSIPEGLDLCAAQGAKEIVVALNFLNSGRHVSGDVPALVEAARQRHSQVKFSITKPVGQHAQIPSLFVDLIKHV